MYTSKTLFKSAKARIPLHLHLVCTFCHARLGFRKQRFGGQVEYLDLSGLIKLNCTSCILYESDLGAHQLLSCHVCTFLVHYVSYTSVLFCSSGQADREMSERFPRNS
jgi:hypothetical protein